MSTVPAEGMTNLLEAWSAIVALLVFCGGMAAISWVRREETRRKHRETCERAMRCAISKGGAEL